MSLETRVTDLIDEINALKQFYEGKANAIDAAVSSAITTIPNPSRVYHVDTDVGADDNPGTQALPIASIDEALDRSPVAGAVSIILSRAQRHVIRRRHTLGRQIMRIYSAAGDAERAAVTQSIIPGVERGFVTGSGEFVFDDVDVETAYLGSNTSPGELAGADPAALFRADEGRTLVVQINNAALNIRNAHLVACRLTGAAVRLGLRSVDLSATDRANALAADLIYAEGTAVIDFMIAATASPGGATWSDIVSVSNTTFFRNNAGV